MFFTAGPSQLYPTLPAHIQSALDAHIGSISHRSSAYKEIHRTCVENLKRLWDIPADHEVLFFASATEIWERLLQNCVAQQSVHFVNGAFSARFAQIAAELQKPHLVRKAQWGTGFEFEPEGIPADAELLNFTHNESSTGVMQPLDVVYAYGEAFPNALLTLDVVSSAPYPVLDFSRLDAVYFSVQKGFGLPAGLGVLVASPRLIAKASQMEAAGLVTGSYHRLSVMAKKAAQQQTVETPNVWNIYLLGKVIADMLDKGISVIRQETDLKYEMVMEAIDKHPIFSPYVADSRFCSRTVICLNTLCNSQTVISQLKEKGFVLGDGYDQLKGLQIRIANFPAHSPADMMRLCAELERL